MSSEQADRNAGQHEIPASLRTQETKPKKEGAAIEAGQKDNPLVQQLRMEQKAHEKTIDRLHQELLGLSPAAVSQKLTKKFEEAEDRGDEKDFLNDVGEMLYRLRAHPKVPGAQDRIAGAEKFLGEASGVMKSDTVKEYEKDLRQKEEIKKMAHLGDNNAGSHKIPAEFKK